MNEADKTVQRDETIEEERYPQNAGRLFRSFGEGD
jgi:hypothetical protein